MLDFRMDTFITVCKYMNFTKAAQELNITQPAVSQHISYLEKEYQIKLFEQRGKKMILTSLGGIFLNAVTTMKHDDIYLREKLIEVQKNVSRLVFGVTLTVGEFVIPAHLVSYLKTHSDTSIEMVVSNTSELLKKINNGEIDFALVEGFFAKSEYDSLPYSKEEYIAVCGVGYQFCNSYQTIEDLLQERIIVREPGSGTREILERYMGGRNLTIHDFKNIIEIGNINAIKTLTEANCGITFLYQAAVKEELKSGRLKKIPLQDFPVTHGFTFIWRKGSIFSEYYHELFEQLKQ